MGAKKLLVVLGSTGAQGGSVAEYALKHLSDKYAVRGLTRDTTKPAAQRLASLGAEMVAANFDDEVSVAKALAGANLIFGITNFWDQYSLEIEVRQGLLIAKVASELPHLEHFIYSSLPDATQLAGGRYQNVLPYNAKTNIRDGMKKLYPQLWEKTTTLFISFYFENWLKYSAAFGPEKQPDGSYALIQPYKDTAAVSAVSSTDTGLIAAEIFRGGAKYFNMSVSLVARHITVGQMLKLWGEILNVKTEFKEVTPAEFQAHLEGKGFPAPLANATAELCQVMTLEDRYIEAEGILRGRELLGPDVPIQSWEEYVKKEDWSSFLN
ncbi:hypothetical protein POJ06DRAFT_287586 [Lipomyces tetrasporus]|uniref:NmrA-like domain-containing protein n=1 Tax=Lipomyces tetrasporus TaxID=54092 RepID=A0AAD7VNM6_9ASCO|nr:uncharacterized protein POJ06DRAFT_287586 [Lipomyces tetrasporus]KAJ8096427.1 hypothetical protein POJ06DRAFT_287586 [Lipomyces tetrasporus]